MTDRYAPHMVGKVMREDTERGSPNNSLLVWWMVRERNGRVTFRRRWHGPRELRAIEPDEDEVLAWAIGELAA